jgi:hypothetical protein
VRALRAFIAGLELYVVADNKGRVQALVAMAAAATAMQPKERFAAKKVIPAALDWADEDRLWASMGFDPFDTKLKEATP